MENKKRMEVKEVELKENVIDREFTEEETTNQLLVNEEDFIKGLIDSVETEKEAQLIEIVREGKVKYAFRIQPLGEEEYNWCREKYTKYVRNKQLGIKLPEKTDTVKFHSSLIYHATVEKDREKLWDNKRVWDALTAKGVQIVDALSVIEAALRAGEKDKVVNAIDKLSGFADSQFEEVMNQEEAIKN